MFCFFVAHQAVDRWPLTDVATGILKLGADSADSLTVRYMLNHLNKSPNVAQRVLPSVEEKILGERLVNPRVNPRHVLGAH